MCFIPYRGDGACIEKQIEETSYVFIPYQSCTEFGWVVPEGVKKELPRDCADFQEERALRVG